MHIGIMSSCAFLKSAEHALTRRLVYEHSAEDCNLFRGSRAFVARVCEQQEDGEP